MFSPASPPANSLPGASREYVRIGRRHFRLDVHPSQSNIKIHDIPVYKDLCLRRALSGGVPCCYFTGRVEIGAPQTRVPLIYHDT